MLYQRNYTFMQNDPGKFQQKNVLAKSWSLFTWYVISYIILYFIFYELIKNLQFLITNLCVLSKLFLQFWDTLYICFNSDGWKWNMKKTKYVIGHPKCTPNSKKMAQSWCETAWQWHVEFSIYWRNIINTNV